VVARRLFHLGEPIDWKIGLVAVVGTLAIVAGYYAPARWTTAVDILAYLVVPLAVVVFAFREDPREYGFRLGDWRAGLVLTVASIAVMAPVLYVVVKSDPVMRSYYAWQTVALPWQLAAGVFAWEFLFRGFWLFGLARRYGTSAIWIQAVPFALAHLGKPGIEAATAIFGGIAFGWIAYRTRSFLYPFAIHYFVVSFTILVAARIVR